MDRDIIEFRNKRLENLIISASADLADAAEASYHASLLASMSKELVSNCERKLEDIYILVNERGGSTDKE